MDFSALKLGFQNYLQEQNETSGKNYANIDSSVSIFMYGTEFKNYLINEIGADSSIFSKTISEILEMDFENGKLVDKSDQETNSDTFENEDNSKDSDFMMGLINNLLEDKEFSGYIDADESGAIDETEAKDFISSIAGENNEGEITFDSVAENVLKMTGNQEVDPLDELRSKIYDNKTVIKALDSDGNGELSEEETMQFEEYVKGYDGDSNDLTEEDLKLAVDDIIDGKFSYGTLEQIDPEKNDFTFDDLNIPSEDSTKGANQSSSPVQASRGGGGSSPAASFWNGSSASSTSADGNVDNMSLEQLENERTTKQGELQDAKSALNDVYSGENEAVKQAVEDQEAAKEASEEAIEEDDKISDELKENRKDVINRLETQQGVVDECKTAINDKKGEISNQKSVVSASKSNVDALTSALSELKGQKTDDPDKQAEINAKITEAEAKLEQAKTQLEKDEGTLDDLEDALKDLEADLKTQEGTLTNIENEKTEIEEEILGQCSSETKQAIKESMQNYDDARAKVESTKQAEAEAANKTVNELQGELDEINNKINEKKAEQTKKEFSVTNSSLPSEVVEKLDGKLGSGFCDRLEEICEKMKCDPEALVGLMFSESGINPTSVNSSSGATGLIQFLPSTARNFGTTTEALKQMSAVEQLDYVEKYLTTCKSSYFGDGEMSAGDLYSLVWLPARSKSGDFSGYYSSGLDMDKNGTVTKDDLSKRIEAKYMEWKRSVGLA